MGKFSLSVLQYEVPDVQLYLVKDELQMTPCLRGHLLFEASLFIKRVSSSLLWSGMYRKEEPVSCIKRVSSSLLWSGMNREEEPKKI